MVVDIFTYYVAHIMFPGRDIVHRVKHFSSLNRLDSYLGREWIRVTNFIVHDVIFTLAPLPMFFPALRIVIFPR